jgi:hypothetical protein
VGRRSFSFLVLALTLVLGFAVAGCGGGGKKSSSGTTAAAATTEAATTEAATTEAATTAAATTTKPPNVTTFATSGNCREFANFASNVGKAVSGTGVPDLQSVAKAIDRLADKAPSDIRSDFKVLADAYDKIAAALKGVNLQSGKAPSADAIAKLQKLQTEINQQKLTTASQHIEAWVQKNCKK